MIGAIIGDIVGSRFEFNNYRKKDFELFSKRCFFTDDTVMSLAIAKAVLEYKLNNTDLYISGGIGTLNYKLRFNNKPSINFYRIVKGS